MSLLINHNCWKLTFDPDHTARENSLERKPCPFMSVTAHNPTLYYWKRQLTFLHWRHLPVRERMKNTQFRMIHQIKDSEICVAGILVICGKLLNHRRWEKWHMYDINTNLLKFNTIIVLLHRQYSLTPVTVIVLEITDWR